MKRLLKSTSDIFNSQVEELTDIFHGYKKTSSAMISRLKKLGYSTSYNNVHLKIYYNNDLVTTLSHSSSDRNSGMQAIRQFRRYWENKK